MLSITDMWSLNIELITRPARRNSCNQCFAGHLLFVADHVNFVIN